MSDIPAWLDKQFTASFRGVEFHIKSSELSGGRKAAKHEFLNKDKATGEDLGGVGEEFTFDAFVVGDDYYTDRDRLKDALSSKGPGELIHPFYGQRNVFVRSFSIKEESTKGGLATFKLTFFESETLNFPKVTFDKKSKIFGVADSLRSASRTGFFEKFTLNRLPQYVIDSSVGKITDILEVIEKQALNAETIVSNEINSLTANILEVKESFETITSAPSSMIENLENSFKTLLEVFSNDEDSLQAQTSILNRESDQTTYTPTFQTPARGQEASNLLAIDQFVNQQLIANSVVVAVSYEFPSVDEAIEVRSNIVEKIESEMEVVENYEVFSSLQQLKADVLTYIPGDEIPAVNTLSLQSHTPSLVLAYDLYEDLSMEADIIRRNDIENPSFISPNIDLEILGVE